MWLLEITLPSLGSLPVSIEARAGAQTAVGQKAWSKTRACEARRSMLGVGQLTEPKAPADCRCCSSVPIQRTLGRRPFIGEAALP